MPISFSPNDLLYAETLFEGDCLKDIKIVACQHLLRSTFYMFNSFLHKGLKTENLSVIGKCYSSSDEVIAKLRKKNIYVHDSSNEFSSHEAFDRQLERNIQSFVKLELFSENLHKFKKVILLDDGGKLLLEANKILEDSSNVIGIEQTSSGFNELQKYKLKFPIVNVARSYAKLQYESPMIVKACLNVFLKEMQQKLQKLRESSKLLIVGNGAIGKSFFEHLESDYSIDAFDIKQPGATKFKLRSMLNNYDIIIGCTGETILSEQDYCFFNKKEVTLVSASSSDREFDAVHIRRRIGAVKNCHETIEYENIKLLNCGFPINFSGGRFNGTPLEDIQFTMALLFVAVMQAALTNFQSMGFCQLNWNYQSELINYHFSCSNRDKYYKLTM